MMKQCLVIGYGNTLRSDDGVGQKVAEIVAGWELQGVRSLPVHQLTPELADDMAQVDNVIFVDAVPSEGDQVIIKTLENDSTKNGFGHTSSPEFLLYLTEKLYEKKPASYWILIPAINFEFGENFSEITDQGRAIALQKIREIILTL
jgi:hydrogenase maturation protease